MESRGAEEPSAANKLRFQSGLCLFVKLQTFVSRVYSLEKLLIYYICHQKHVPRASLIVNPLVLGMHLSFHKSLELRTLSDLTLPSPSHFPSQPSAVHSRRKHQTAASLAKINISNIQLNMGILEKTHRQSHTRRKTREKRNLALHLISL